jgi:formylglycine-generating enzyme required for sulfatase activity
VRNVTGITQTGEVKLTVSLPGYIITPPDWHTVTVYAGPTEPEKPEPPEPPPATVIEMVLIPAGTFTMGSPDTEANRNTDETQHSVTLTKGFYMGKYQVTQAQYQAVMGSNPSYFHGGTGREPASGGVQGNRPVDTVSWYDAIVFCNKLSIAEGLTPAYSISGSTNPDDWGAVPTVLSGKWGRAEIVSGSTGYRLPTEAQWEYAAKGGNGSPGNYTYSGSNDLNEVGWYLGNIPSQNSGESGYGTQPVGTKAPNGLGLYDMSGNVWEWCWDVYTADITAYTVDPPGPDNNVANYRVQRGGGWQLLASYARSGCRARPAPYNRNNNFGFRLVRP